MLSAEDRNDVGGCTSRRKQVSSLIAVIAAWCAVGFHAERCFAQPNDLCSNATVLTEGVAVSGSSVGATGIDETQTTACQGVDTADVWFVWTAPCEGNVTVSTCGSNYNTTVAYYTGDTNLCGFVPDDACNDNFCGQASQLTFFAFMNNSYLFRIAGVNGATGDYTILVTCPPTGVCCSPGGACQVVTQDTCENVLAGNYLGNGTICDPIDRCSTGACCAPGGCEQQADAPACESIGGVYQGDGSACAEVNCPAFGACCTGVGGCMDQTSAACATSGGVYLGNGTNCNDNGMTCMVGACCMPDGMCDDTGDAGACIGGTYQGDGTNCNTAPCPGAGDDCAFPIIVQSEIVLNGSTTGSTGTDVTLCTSNDFEDVWHLWTANCTGEITVSLCGSDYDTSLAVFSACPPSTELACDDDFPGCGVQSQVTFSAIAGTDYLIRVSGYNGSDGNYSLLISCPPVGACCIGEGMCEIQSAEECQQAGNIYLGNASTCEVEGQGCATGACCTPDGGCSDSGDEAACDAANGRYFGAGSICANVTCPEFGACCTEGACTQNFADVCFAGGGSFIGAAVPCEATTCHGACCDTSGAGCEVVSEDNCQSAQSIFFGPGSNCGQIACPDEHFIPLNYNWNGLVHAGEEGQPDSPNGYRSIGDRGNTVGNPNSIGGAIASLTLGNLTYFLEQRAVPRLDTVHIGFRRDAFDLAVPGANADVGISPSWDPSLLGDGKNVPSSTTNFGPTAPLDGTFELGILYNASENGGDFDMTLGFTDATNITVRFDAADWFANGTNTTPAPAGLGVATQVRIPGPLSGGDGFEGTSNVDSAVFPTTAQPLSIIHGHVTQASLQTGLGFDVTGKRLNSITFNNWSPNSVGNMAAGVGIYAASLVAPAPTGECDCLGDVSGNAVVDGGDIQGYIDCLLGGGANCDCADVTIPAFVSNLLTANPGCL